MSGLRCFLVVLLVLGLATPSLASGDEKLRVVASFSILGDMVQEVAGDLAEVTTIVGPDTDAHVYEPNIADARAVADADIVFVNGLGFETWINTLISESGTKATVYLATEGVRPVKVGETKDPHAWNLPSNGALYVQNIVRALADARPEFASRFRAKGEVYQEELYALEREVRQKFATLPGERQVVVTAHDAFGYLESAYDLVFLAPLGIDSEAEPSAQALALLIEQLKRERVAALFVENITSPVLLQQIAVETELTVGGRLFSDALSRQGGPATSYLNMLKHNFDTLYAALRRADATRGSFGQD